MPNPLMRIPYTGPLPPPRIVPRDATTTAGAVKALATFLTAGSSSAVGGRPPPSSDGSTVILTGAGISVASGLADYRGVHGTYTLNKSYRPIYFHEFVRDHEARKRYWARSFVGWTVLDRARPNVAHRALDSLGQMGLVKQVITQNVDSFHAMAHPSLPTIELHGFLRSLVCLSCGALLSRALFQQSLSRLNPAWAAFLADVLASGALETENPAERRAKGMKTNPDGDVDLPDAPYSTFRYPACGSCLARPPRSPDGKPGRVDVDEDGAWQASSTAGILKPAVVMFGESISNEVKAAAEAAVDDASRMLVIGSSLATYSAWRLVRRAQERGMPLAILNLGGVRGEAELFAQVPLEQDGRAGVRVEMRTDVILPLLVDEVRTMQRT